MKYRELHKLLSDRGFVIARSSKHIIYTNGSATIAVPHARSIAPGTLRDIFKILYPNDPGMANRQMRMELGKVA